MLPSDVAGHVLLEKAQGHAEQAGCTSASIPAFAVFTLLLRHDTFCNAKTASKSAIAMVAGSLSRMSANEDVALRGESA